MQSGDGLIVRLRLTGSIVDTALAQRIAAWSSRWGNGLIDLSGRANLQMRGFSAQRLPDLHDALGESGLLDHSAAAEAVRNVVSSPLAGLDPDAELDVRPVVRRLERRLVGDSGLHWLPGKFGFAIDDGGGFGLGDVPVDVRFVAGPGPAFVIHLADDPVGRCATDGVCDVAARLARVFLGQTGARRMRDLVARRGAEAIAREAGIGYARWPLPARKAAAFLGAQALGSGGFLGIGLPFGRVAAAELSELAILAAGAGGRELRLTPWRAILVPVASLAAAQALSAALPAGRFILDAGDPRWRVAACPGAPSCDRATTPARDDAARLAAQIDGRSGSGIAIHVSGCEKGCAHPRAAPVTLVGRGGRYDLVLDGLASGAPALRDLTLAQAADALR
jgi:precorrin-3B synthase